MYVKKDGKKTFVDDRKTTITTTMWAGWYS